jgi:hypothetical protein
VNCDAITLCVASQRVFIVVYFVIDSVRKLLGTPSNVVKKICADYVRYLLQRLRMPGF